MNETIESDEEQRSTEVRKERARRVVIARDSAPKASRALGWFSLGLGLGELVFPGRVARLAGVNNRFATRSLMRALGAREVAAGVGLFSQPTKPGWLWTRVLGDLVDLALLGAAMFSRRTNRRRTGLATAAIVGVTAIDAWAGQAALAAGAAPVRRAITIGRSSDEVYEYWRQLTNLPLFMKQVEAVEVLDPHRSRWLARGSRGQSVVWDAEILEDRPGELLRWRSFDGAMLQHEGKVRFSPTPDLTGTEVHWELRPGPSRGLGAVLRALVEPVSEVVVGGKMDVDLGRLKQLLETGEIAHSDASIHRRPHAARPAAASEKTEGTS